MMRIFYLSHDPGNLLFFFSFYDDPNRVIGHEFITANLIR